MEKYDQNQKKTQKPAWKPPELKSYGSYKITESSTKRPEWTGDDAGGNYQPS